MGCVTSASRQGETELTGILPRFYAVGEEKCDPNHRTALRVFWPYLFTLWRGRPGREKLMSNENEGVTQSSARHWQ